MSRIGKQPIPIPQGVKILLDGGTVRAEGPKGKLSQPVPAGLVPKMMDGTVVIERGSDEREVRALHGLARALVANMVTGVKDGFERRLEIVGIGYRAQMQGKSIQLALGYSHPVPVPAPEGINFVVESPIKFRVEGIDKQQVGEVAANIRKLRKPDPYKGKGVRYAGEVVRRKVGKTGK